MSGGRVRRSRGGVLARLVLGTFVLVLLTGPFLHHDFACHQKSSTHCTSCMSSPFAAGVEHSWALTPLQLPLVGPLHRESVQAAGALIASQLPGRSPPHS
ncbi:MAG: hypothetical protein HYZ58_01740 [Acidobacteria bacterium]|nr:hypothetical protein [Acidobacteriota bacterium]MBI3261857.1 hypothetical protein [Acidobacteriota bacterium]